MVGRRRCAPRLPVRALHVASPDRSHASGSVIDGRPVSTDALVRRSTTSAARLTSCVRQASSRFSRRSSRRRRLSAFELFRRARRRRGRARSRTRRTARCDQRGHAGRHGDHVDRIRPPGIPRVDAARDRAAKRPASSNRAFRVVVGRLDPEAAAVIDGRGAAARRHESFRRRRMTWRWIRRLGLRGAHQQLNAAVAVRVLAGSAPRGLSIAPARRLLQRAVEPRLARTPRSPPSRLTAARLLLDAAHNPAGAAALASYLTGAWDVPPAAAGRSRRCATRTSRTDVAHHCCLSSAASWSTRVESRGRPIPPRCVEQARAIAHATFQLPLSRRAVERARRPRGACVAAHRRRGIDLSARRRSSRRFSPP